VKKTGRGKGSREKNTRGKESAIMLWCNCPITERKKKGEKGMEKGTKKKKKKKDKDEKKYERLQVGEGGP